MATQHTENLFRRFKGQMVTIKTLSQALYEGRVAEISNDYVCLIERQDGEGSQVFVFFNSMESMMPAETNGV
jgi:hypothetical protein